MEVLYKYTLIFYAVQFKFFSHNNKQRHEHIATQYIGNVGSIQGLKFTSSKFSIEMSSIHNFAIDS
jgi:hypothetical protein